MRSIWSIFRQLHFMSTLFDYLLSILDDLYLLCVVCLFRHTYFNYFYEDIYSHTHFWMPPSPITIQQPTYRSLNAGHASKYADVIRMRLFHKVWVYNVENSHAVISLWFFSRCFHACYIGLTMICIWSLEHICLLLPLIFQCFLLDLPYFRLSPLSPSPEFI